MEQLNKMYEALDLLKQLGLPISGEQLRSIKAAEGKYIDEEIVPLIEETLAPAVEKLQSDFILRVSYSKENGLQISQEEDVQEETSSTPRKGPQNRFILKVTFPDGTVISDKSGATTLLQVINKIGGERVSQVEIPILGVNLVSKEKCDNDRYSVAQYPTNDGYYVMTYSDSERKAYQIKTISKRLGLGLQVEKVRIERNQEDGLWDEPIEEEQ